MHSQEGLVQLRRRHDGQVEFLGDAADEVEEGIDGESALTRE